MGNVQRGMGDGEVQLCRTKHLQLKVIRDNTNMASYQFLLFTETKDQRNRTIFF